MANTLSFNSTIFQQFNTSDSTPLATQIATRLLESFVPGYATAHAFILEVFHFDTSVLVIAAAGILLTIRLCRHLWTSTLNLLWNFWTSKVVLDGFDDAWDHLSFLLEDPKYTGRSRYLQLKTKYEHNCADLLANLEFGPDGRWLNFSNQSSMRKTIYSPGEGAHWFRINGRYFRFTRSVTENNWGGTSEKIHISCYGPSTSPIKNLIVDAKKHYYKMKKGNNGKTSIYRPGKSYYSSPWAFATERHCRPIDTIVLDQDIKEQILEDINEYLHPHTERWYSNRGIPYRRGYLFYGPPGTGKSSICFALAGVFGLDVYVMSLLKKGLSEEELVKLFTSLPTRCLVLLEDIDAADLRNRKLPGEKSEDKSTDAEAKEEKEEDASEGISLSALLNAIDGVASQEGRVLIMTTNKPESLDKALVRPGRVDLQIGFQNATQKQAREIFERMYISDDVSTSTTHSSGSEKTSKSPNKPQENNNLLAADIKSLAQQFAAMVPDGLFSPAELQGFLVRRKKNPSTAVRDVEGWVKQTLEQKKEEAKKSQ